MKNPAGSFSVLPGTTGERQAQHLHSDIQERAIPAAGSDPIRARKAQRDARDKKSEGRSSGKGLKKGKVATPGAGFGDLILRSVP
jgi:hypothetical protein